MEKTAVGVAVMVRKKAYWNALSWYCVGSDCGINSRAGG